MFMHQSVLEMTKDLVKAQIQAGDLTSDDMRKALQDTHDSLMALQVKEEGVEAGVISVTGRPSGSIDWRKSITRHAIACLECGAVYKQLSNRHLREHDLTARLYRAKYSIPRTLPLAARETTALRRKVVQETRPWEKAPRYLEMQAGKAAAAKKPMLAKRSGQTKNG